MTAFLVHLWNHSPLGRMSLLDPIGIMGHQIRSLGHTIVHDPANDDCGRPKYLTKDAGLNILVEGFTPGVIAEIAGAHAQGARFLCLATEDPCEISGQVGFNQATSKEMVERQRIFPEAMKYFDGILHLVPGERVTRWYGQFGPPAAQAELGYAPTIHRPLLQAGHPPFIFGFYGSLTKRRLNLLKRLAKRTGVQKAVRIVADFKTQDERNAAMREARVVLQVRKFEEMGLVSSSRCNIALSCGRPVVAEPHDLELSKPWDEIVAFSRSEQEFFDLALLTARRWRDAYSFQFARFKEKLTPEYCVGIPLQKLGVLPGSVRKAA